MRAVPMRFFSKTRLLAAFSIICTGALIANPQVAIDASIRGLSMWWYVVFPSLLPFFIMSELLIGFGVVSFLGVLLEPFMRPIFRVPGHGGFVWAMGLASGNPAGAKLAVRMRQANVVTRIEGERLTSFTSSANPLFIFGAIAVGFFHHPNLGLLLAIAHYGGNILVGLCFRFYGTNNAQRTTIQNHNDREGFTRLYKNRIQTEQTLGILLGDAVRTSIQTLLLIGGFIILFSVLSELLTTIGLLSIAATAMSGIFAIIGLHTDLSKPFIAGIFEITIGIEQISTLPSTPLAAQIIVTSFILAFGGLSIQAQVASILAESDLRFRPFFYARLLHGLFAAVLTAILFQPLYVRHAVETTTFAPFNDAIFGTTIWALLQQYGGDMTLIALIVFIFLNARKQTRPVFH
ncbi:sporulation integral membrane protein YlbJ [Bacillus sp. FSL W7-1360]